MSRTNVSEHTATIYFYKLQLIWRVSTRKNTKLRTRREHVAPSNRKKKKLEPLTDVRPNFIQLFLSVGSWVSPCNLYNALHDAPWSTAYPLRHAIAPIMYVTINSLGGAEHQRRARGARSCAPCADGGGHRGPLDTDLARGLERPFGSVALVKW